MQTVGQAKANMKNKTSLSNRSEILSVRGSIVDYFALCAKFCQIGKLKIYSPAAVTKFIGVISLPRNKNSCSKPLLFAPLLVQRICTSVLTHIFAGVHKSFIHTRNYVYNANVPPLSRRDLRDGRSGTRKCPPLTRLSPHRSLHLSKRGLSRDTTFD
jgi:hypothetical protein